MQPVLETNLFGCGMLTTRMMSTCALLFCIVIRRLWIFDDGHHHDHHMINCSNQKFNDKEQDVKRVSWHPAEDLLASASYDNSVKLYR